MLLQANLNAGKWFEYAPLCEGGLSMILLFAIVPIQKIINSAERVSTPLYS